MILCPACNQEVAPPDEECPACGVRLAFEGDVARPVFPAITPGRVLAVYDFARVPLPGLSERSLVLDKTDSMSAAVDGVVLAMTGGIRWFSQPYLRIRDVCVRLCFDALLGNPAVRVGVRRQHVGDASLCYELVAHPSVGDYRLARSFSSSGGSGSTDLRGPEPVGLNVTGSNLIELRAQGPTLQVLVNEEAVCALHDAVLGIGAVSIGLGALDANPVQVKLRWFDVREVTR